MYTPSLQQTEYQILVKSIQGGLTNEHIVSIFENQDEIDDPIDLIEDVSSRLIDKEINEMRTCSGFNNDQDLQLPETFDKKKKNLVVFDDCAYDKQSNIHGYFIRGRHYNINCIYLSQSYFQLPKRSIRDNSNCFIFFKLKAKDIANVWQDIASLDMQLDSFKTLCNEAWKVKHGYLYVDTTETELDKKYRFNIFSL